MSEMVERVAKGILLCMNNVKPRCANCDDHGWVCENHPDVPWAGIACYGCECGAGMPCSCNDANPPWNYQSPAEAAQ